MTLRICSCCGKLLQTSDVYIIGKRNELGLWVNCKSCNSTMVLNVKTIQKRK